MSGKIIHYFAGGNTAKGFYSLYESNLQGLERVFILKGGPGTGKSSLMQKIGNDWADSEFDIEFIHSPFDPNSIDGVVIPALSVGIVDGSSPHVIEPKAPGAVEELVNLGAAWDAQELRFQKGRILKLSGKINDAYQKAYVHFKEALGIHDEWEKVYINSMDIKRADRLTSRLIEMFFGKMRVNKNPDARHRFLGAATPEGAVDFIPNLTEAVSKRYFLKGRPGSGKSTMLKKIANAALNKGFDTEIYHCGFDPDSLDMLIFRELGICIFDSTAPHEYFPSRDGDEIIDMYDMLITPGTDETNAHHIKKISAAYKNKMAEATSYLAGAKKLADELKTIYMSAMDFTAVDLIREKISEEINELAGIQPKT